MKNWDDKDYVLNNVKQSGISLLFASGSLKADKEVVLAAVENDGIAIFYADNSLRSDKEFLVDCAAKSHIALMGVESLIFNDFSFCKRLVSVNPKSFFVISKYYNYSGDKELCLLACKDSSTLLNMDKTLFLDLQFVEELINVNPQTFKIISRLKNSDGAVYNKNIELIKLATFLDAYNIMYIDNEYKNNLPLLINLITANPEVYKYISYQNKLQEELALAAIKQKAEMLLNVPSIICTSKFLAKAVKVNSDIYNLIKDKDKTMDLASQLTRENVDNFDKYIVDISKDKTFNFVINSNTSKVYNPDTLTGLALN